MQLLRELVGRRGAAGQAPAQPIRGEITESLDQWRTTSQSLGPFHRAVSSEDQGLQLFRNYNYNRGSFGSHDLHPVYCLTSDLCLGHCKMLVNYLSKKGGGSNLSRELSVSPFPQLQFITS